MFWWSGVLVALAFGIQKQIEASNLTFAVNYEPFPTSASQDSVLSQQQFSSGKLSRRAKAAQKRSLFQTSKGNVTADTTFAMQLAAIRALPRDSSARIAQFTFVRKDNPMVDSTFHKEHPLFLSAPPVVKYQASLDSTKWVYRLRRTVDENDSRIPIDIPFEEYTSLRLKQSVRENWELMSQFYSQELDAKTSLGDLMGKITKIEVPIPKNPIFSIFGPNIIKLSVNGAIDIHAGFSNTKYDLATSNPLGQSQSTPDFKQQIQVTVNGEIGDKLNIAADWNTQRTFEYENQLHIKYTGYDDEIVQSVEAGNVSLPTNSSFISGGSALFGILAKFQLGPLRLTTVATQKKGQVKEISVSGGGEAKPIEIHPAGYSTNHFFIDTSYIGLYEDYFLNNHSKLSMKIRQIEVWVTYIGSGIPQGSRHVVAFMNQDTVEMLQKGDTVARRKSYDPIPGEVEQGLFIKLDQSQYDVNYDAGIISLKTSLQNQAVAVNYIISNLDNSPRYIGLSGQVEKDFQDSSKLIMKLVCPKNLQNNLKTAWKLQLKNRYPLGVFGIDKQSFEFHIEYQLPGQTAMKEVSGQNIGLLELFGLDRFTGSGSSQTPDKVFDYNPGYTIDEANGEIIFPTVEPFDSLSIKKFLTLHQPALSTSDINTYCDSLSYDAIYDTSASAAENDPKNRYYLRGTVKGSGSASFSIGFNTVEGSVQVISGGQPLTPGVDYTVDYISGKVFIKNQMYLAPGRDIQIKYEANDMFQLASKSLIGARGEFNLAENTSLGFTVMKYSQQSLSDKVRLGEEPISNIMLGLDSRTAMDAPWLTNALNFLPGIKTTTLSKISLSGEVAYMLPNPNTRTSPISSDGGKGVAYIDDFEGAKQTIPLGGSYLVWKDASAPWYSPTLDTSYTSFGIDGRSISTGDAIKGIMSDAEKMNYKARACWFNVTQSDVTIHDIWAKKSAIAGQDQVQSLDFYFRPAVRGEFNYSKELERTIGLNEGNTHQRSWAGMQRVLGSTSSNLVDQNVAFIELWVNILGQQDSVAKLNIDLGYISEDVFGDRKFHTEDGLDNPSHIQRGTLNPNYDWGLDTMSDAMEQNVYKDFVAQYPQYFGDPSGDNWAPLPLGGRLTGYADADKYDKVNGTEGNHLSTEGLLPDGEDLNGNKSLDRINSYFEYEIPLDTSSYAFQHVAIGKGAKNGWQQIRIPLSDYTRRIGEPSLTSVEGVRLWVTGASTPILFRVVEFNLVGNQWIKRDQADASYEIGVINIEDNPDYSYPPGVTQQQSLTQSTTNNTPVLDNEQSLNLIVDSLHDGVEKEVVRSFEQKPLDMFNYHTLKMFVHGETGAQFVKGYRKFNYTDTSYDAQFFIRFGDDIYNYYEYSAPVHPGWIGNDVIIKFADLTSLKARDTATVSHGGIPVTGGPPGAKYRLLGNPRLDQIKFISIGIRNPKGIGDTVLTGELWADELRLTDVDNTPGWAYKFDAKISLADIGSIAFSLTETNPFFHQLEVPFGSRNTSRSWNISTAFSFGKLLPESWAGTVLDASYSHSESMTRSLYVPGTDISVATAAAAVASSTTNDSTREYKNADDVRLKSEILSITDSYSIPTIKLNVPFKTWLVTETINKMTFGYNYTSTHRRDYSTEFYEESNWSANFLYSTQFNKNNYVTPFSIFGDFFILRPWKNFKLFFTPQQISFGATLSQRQSESQARTETATLSLIHSMSATRSMNFNWQFFEGGLFDFGIGYNVSISSSLDNLEERNGKLRSLYDILSDMFFSHWLINFGIDQNYSQSIILNTKLAAPKVLMLDKIVTPKFQYGASYGWTDQISLGPIGKSASWTTNPSFSLDVSLKPITDAIWSSTPASVPVDTVKGKKSNNPLKQLGDITRILIKNTLFGFEKINLSFTQSNSANNNGVYGDNGFANLFTRVPFFQSSLAENGPSLFYQLGLISDPNGRLVLKTKGAFPFITGYTVPGLRAADANLTDNYSQNNNISVQTSRPLWEGATLDLNWKVGWSYNENTTGTSNDSGVFKKANSMVSGSLNRSYISLPSFLMFKFFNTNLDNVNKKYVELQQQDANNSIATGKDKLLSQAFEQGLEAFPWLTKILGSIAPRANWAIHWSGLESFSLFKSFATSVSLDHSYSSTYTESWQLTQLGDRDITNQSVMYGFAPLIGLNITFKDLAKGKLNATFRYNSTTTYNLTPSAATVGEDSRSDIAISGTFSRQGFEIPFFGLSLMNNIDISISYSYSHSSTLRYDFNAFQSSGLPINGQVTTTIEPSIRYTLSERVTAKLYYRYSKLSPDAGGATISGSTTNEGGLDLSIAIK